MVATRIRGGAELPNAVLMDRQMPVLSGVEATARLRSLGYRGLIVGVTGSALAEELSQFQRAGANVVLPKPLNMQTVDEFLKLHM